MAWATSNRHGPALLMHQPAGHCRGPYLFHDTGPYYSSYGIFGVSTHGVFVSSPIRRSTGIGCTRHYLNTGLISKHCRIVDNGRQFALPFTPADPTLTVMHLLVHAGYHPHSVQFKFTHVDSPQHLPNRPGRPMLMISLPFPAAAQRIGGAPAVAYFGHNADLQAALSILKEGCIRPSNFEPLDASWLPSTAFYSRASVHSLGGALRAAARFGGWASSRTICVFGRVPICYLDIANTAPANSPSSVLPNTPAGYHLKSDAGGTIPENAANYFVSIVHGNDNRWGVHSTLAQPEGIAVFL
ncbi:B'ETA [Symbiodinium sp. CCMP2592]|nr:B'ETA [Symbiodinium sp. CCMP2592]